jgi:hypothetical protein
LPLVSLATVHKHDTFGFPMALHPLCNGFPMDLALIPLVMCFLVCKIFFMIFYDIDENEYEIRMNINRFVEWKNGMDKLYIEIDNKLTNSNLVGLQESIIQAHPQRLQELYNSENLLT